MVSNNELPSSIRGFVVSMSGHAHVAIGVTEYNAESVMDDVIRTCERELIRSRDIHHDKEKPLSEQLFHKFQHDILAEVLNGLYAQQRNNTEEILLRRKYPSPVLLP